MTVLAGLLVVALTAALAGPYFVDWTKHRDVIEESLSRALEVQIKIAGGIDVKLLPVPRLVLENVSATAAGGSSAVAASVRLELAPMALLRGDLRFTDAHIEKPAVQLSGSKDGELAFALPSSLRADHIAFEHFVVNGGRLLIVDSAQGSLLQANGLNLEAAAPSLAGPWRGSGSFDLLGASTGFYFNTGVAEDNKLRLKLVVDAIADRPRGEFDGALLAVSGAKGGIQLSLEGQAKLSGILNAPGLSAPWEASGPLRADAKAIELAPLEMRAGGEDRTISATGHARFERGDKMASVFLESARVDVDYLAGGKQQAGGLGAAGQILTGLFSGARGFLSMKLAFKTPALSIGAETLGDVFAELTPIDERTAAFVMRSRLPGRGNIDLNGIFERGPAARYKGQVKFEARDLGRLSQWIGGALPSLAAQIETLPFTQFAFSGGAEISAAGFFARDADLVADRSEFRGLINYTRPIGNERARVVLDLVSPAIDLDALPDLTPLAQASSGADFAITLDAKAVRLARAGQGMIDAGRILARVRRNRDIIDIEQFDIANLGGASFSARGELGAAAGQIDIKLDANRLVELAQLMQRVAPGIWSDALARRAVALSPATLTFSAQGERKGSDLRLASLAVDGTARGTRISGTVTPAREDGRRLAARFSLVNPQTPILLRQFGLETIPLERLPEGRIEAQADGSFNAGFLARIDASLAGTALSYRGNIAGIFPALQLRGEGRIESSDVSPLLQVLAMALPDAGQRAPVSLTSAIASKNGLLSFGSIEGQALGSKIAGALTLNTSGALTGNMQTDRLSLASLASLVLGSNPPVKSGAIWPDFKFAAAMIEPPKSEVRIEAARVLLPGGAQGENARFQFNLAPGFVALNDIAMSVAGGKASGRIGIRRDGTNASVSGDIAYDGPVASANEASAFVQGSVEFAGTGSSYASIVSSMAGRGQGKLRDLSIGSADPGALARVVENSLDLLQVSEGNVNAAMARELAQTETRLDSAAINLAIAGGRVMVSLRGAGDAFAISGSIDLRSLTLDAQMKLSAPAPDGWTSSPPEAEIRWRGPVLAPKRSLNIAGLLNSLGARAIEREAARIEMLDFDARERAAFNRQNRMREFLQQREMEIAAYHAEQARKVAEEKRRAEEEARRKALEEQRAAARRASVEAERERRERDRAARIPGGPGLATGAPLQLAPPSSGQPAGP